MAATAKLLILLCLSGTALSFLPPFALMSMLRGGEMGQKLPLLLVMMKHPHIMQSPIGMMLMRIFSRAEFAHILPLIANRLDVIIKILQQNPMLMYTLMRHPDRAAKLMVMMSFMGGQGAKGGIDPMALMMMNGNGAEMSNNPMLMMSLMNSMNQGQGATAGEAGAPGGGMPPMDPMAMSLMMNGGEANMGMMAAMNMAAGGTGAAPMNMGAFGGAPAGGAMP